MPRILAIDFGLKRTGIAVSDPLKMIANGLTTIESSSLFKFLEDYFRKEQVELILIGEPKNLDQSDTHATAAVRKI
ncbi:MAG TPA: RuvX/YqgF family protein, partial [Puia sp.]|nr:RuvX/YqgF family protein [Puia sp.]